jgi:hypothetical protein
MAFIDKVNTVVTKTILPDVTDNIFRNDPLLAYFRKNNVEPWQGGTTYQENFLYDTYTPQDYSDGDTFDLTDQQLITGTTVTLRKASVNVSALYEKIKIDLAGPNAAFDHLDAQLQDAALAMSGKLANDLYRDGQQATRLKKINGLDEALNDGSNTGFQGVAFANYLTVARSAVNSALNSPMTGPTASVSGALSYPILESAWQSVVIGPEKPDLMITSNLGFSYIKMVFQPQQRFEEVDPDYGFTTQKLNGTKIVASNYTPGTRTATTADTKVGYTAVSSGETLWFLNTKKFKFYISTDPLFSFGFTGFKVAQDSLTLAGQYMFAGTFTCQAPRYSRYLFAITG